MIDLAKYPQLTKGIDQLFDFQKNAIKSLLNRQNCLVIAPTGKGKSLIYQLAGQETDGISIVICPLIALINEQVSILGKGIALDFTSDYSFNEQRRLLQKLANGELFPKFIFLSPERLQNYFFRAALKKSKLKVSLLVIDEAHCISQWGFDFRPDYSQIHSFVKFLHESDHTPAILAMTATIGKEAKEEIVKGFSIDATCIYTDPDIIRSELMLNFIEVGEEKEKGDVIIDLLETHLPRKTLIYFYNIRWCERINAILNDKGIESGTYFSEMESEGKEKSYTQFKNGEIKVLCATTAFGMGMNIPDIDMVIHHQIPNSIEEYYQQVGRGARDKKICPKALCFLIWSETNFEFKYEEQIKNLEMTVESVEAAFNQFGFKGNNGIPQAIESSDYIAKGLSRYRYAFERRSLMETLGEVNGTPKSIEFVEKNIVWNNLLKKMEYGDSFIRAAKNSGMTIQELIDFVFEKELNGEIKKLPAMKKKKFFVSNYDSIPLETIYEIVNESLRVTEFKKEQLEALGEMIESSDPDSYIRQYFQLNQ